MLTEEEKQLFSEKETSEVTDSGVEGPLAPDQVEFVEKDTALEEKYGDSGFRTLLETAASSATFGLSDQAIAKLGPEYQEALRERRKRNEGAAITGEVAGILGPALFSGGSSLLAKGAGAAGKGVATAAKAGAAIERLTAKGLQKTITDTGSKKFAKEVLRKSIAKGAGSAVEGTFYGVGKLIEENALGNADFNAENLMAYGGQGALWGGVAGGVMGAAPILYKKGAEIVVPKIKNNRIVDYVGKHIDNFKDEYVNPSYNSFKIAGFKRNEILDIFDNQPELAANMPKVLEKVFEKKGLSTIASNQKLYKGSRDYLKSVGDDIGKTLKKIDETTFDDAVLPTRSELASKTIDKLEELSLKFKKPDGGALSNDALKKINYIDDEISFISGDLLKKNPIKATELQNMKMKYHNLGRYDKTGVLTVQQEANREMGKAVRETMLDFSHKVDPTLGQQLRDQLLDYGTLSTFVDKFGKKINGQTSSFFDKAKDILLSSMVGNLYKYGAVANTAIKALAKTDLINKFRVLSGIEKANSKVRNKIRSSISDYMKVKEFKSLPVALSSKLLIDTPLSAKIEEDIPKKKPKNEQEAIKNIFNNFSEMNRNPQYLRNLTSNINLQVAAPETYRRSQQVLQRAMIFLGSKMKALRGDSKEVNPFLKKSYPVSDQEIYKFKKYLNAIQNPLSILKELKNGSLSRESVEAIKFVYPNIYEELKLQVYNQLKDVEQDGKIEYKQRLQLGILMDVTTDLALLPQSIRGFQALYKEAQESQAGGAVGEIKGGPKQGLSASAAKQLDMPESRATELERISNRRDLNRS